MAAARNKIATTTTSWEVATKETQVGSLLRAPNFHGFGGVESLTPMPAAAAAQQVGILG